MLVVKSYAVHVTSNAKLDLPYRAVPLSVKVTNGTPTLFVEYDTESDEGDIELRYFEWFATDKPIKGGFEGRANYIDTVVLDGMAYHFYEILL